MVDLLQDNDKNPSSLTYDDRELLNQTSYVLDKNSNTECVREFIADARNTKHAFHRYRQARIQQDARMIARGFYCRSIPRITNAPCNTSQTRLHNIIIGQESNHKISVFSSGVLR